MRGSIKRRVHQTKDGKTTVNWYVVIEGGRSADGKRRQNTHGAFRTRREAEAARAKLVTAFNAGLYVAPSSVTVAEWITERWLPTMKTQLKPTTWHSYNNRMMKLHVLPTIGTRAIGQVKHPSMIAKLGLARVRPADTEQSTARRRRMCYSPIVHRRVWKAWPCAQTSCDCLKGPTDPTGADLGVAHTRGTPPPTLQSNEPRSATWALLVAGVGFEPTTFGL